MQFVAISSVFYCYFHGLEQIGSYSHLSLALSHSVLSTTPPLSIPLKVDSYSAPHISCSHLLCPRASESLNSLSSLECYFISLLLLHLVGQHSSITASRETWMTLLTNTSSLCLHATFFIALPSADIFMWDSLTNIHLFPWTINIMKAGVLTF